MSNIVHVELTDTFNKQRQVLNQVVDSVNANPPLSAGDGISVSEGNEVSLKITGDGLSFDASGNLVGNDAYANLLTQVVVDPSVPLVSPTVASSTTISFPAFTVLFGKKVYYGKVIDDFEVVNVPSTTMTVESGEDGAVFVFVDNTGAIRQSLSSVTPGNSSVQCMLGSYFRLNNTIQEGSWKYTPWNGSTSKDSRFMNSSSISGGLLSVASANTLARGEVSIIYEGVNISTSLYLPNQISYEAESPYITKKMYPEYNPSDIDTSTIDTTHIYNITNETVDDISDEEGYIILIPGIVAPTGQDVYLMAQSPYTSSTYTQIYESMEAAEAALYGLELEFGNVASRVAWLGQSIIVKIGADNFNDKNQIRIVGDVPSIIKAYASMSGTGSPARVEGLTILANGSVVGVEASKNTIDFDDSFTVTNTSENSVTVSVVDEVTPKMSNCILYIPQDIKLELSLGTLTAKSGSRVYKSSDTTTPTYTLPADKTLTESTDGEYFVFYNGSALVAEALDAYDYSTLPAAYSLPLAMISVSGGSIAKVLKVFNGLGYVGSTMYALPGVVGLVPNGRYADGSLKSIKFRTTTLLTKTVVGTFGGSNIILNASTLDIAAEVEYNNDFNTLSVGNYIIAGSVTAEQGSIIDLEPRNTFHAIDYSDYKKIVDIQGRLLQQNMDTNWPLTTNPDEWPHTLFISTDSNLTISSVVPQFDSSDPKILTWEVVIQNTNPNAAITLTWPAVYQPFNSENLLSVVAPNTSVFMMMRRYSNNYTLVSHQGTQLNSTI